MASGRQMHLGMCLAGFALAGLLVLALPPVAAAPGGGNSASDTHGKPVQNETSGRVEGAFISFEAPSQGALIAHYTSDGLVFIDRVTIPGYAFEVQEFIGGQVRVTGTGAEAQAHDVKTSTLRVSLDQGVTASFLLPADILAAPGANETVIVSAQLEDRSATMWTNCGPGALVIAHAGSQVDASASHACQVFFREHVTETANDSLITAATESGAVAAEVSVGSDPAAGDDVSAFADASVVVTRVDDKIVVTVEAAADAPSSIVVRFVPAGDGRETLVFVDGQPARTADSVEDALNPENDFGSIECAVAQDETSGLAVVSMPTGGSHVIQFQSVARSAPPTPVNPLIAVGLAAAMVAVAAVVLFRRL